jgi:hypothetical protein
MSPIAIGVASAQIVSSARNIQTQVVGIDVDGHRMAQALAYPTWQTLEMLIEGNFVVDGTNEIVITWPVEVDSSEAQLGRAADALGTRRLPYFLSGVRRNPRAVGF